MEIEKIVVALGALVGIAIIPLQIYFGVVGIDHCSFQPMIPIWLLGE